MVFDKSKVYTALNADDIKVGSKGYFANNIANLKDKVELSNLTLCEVSEILDESDKFRFKSEVTGELFNLFYLVEEPQEKTFRPYKDTDEMIEDFKKRYNSYGGWSGKDNPMYCPLIWVQNVCGQRRLVTCLNGNTVHISGQKKDFTLEEFADTYFYLDGSPCGIEE